MEAVSEDYIASGVANKTIRACPFCGMLSELISGCNYVTCVCNQGQNNKSEWCWLCESPKYQPFNDKPACNDASHNSH